MWETSHWQDRGVDGEGEGKEVKEGEDEVNIEGIDIIGHLQLTNDEFITRFICVELTGVINSVVFICVMLVG